MEGDIGKINYKNLRFIPIPMLAVTIGRRPEVRIVKRPYIAGWAFGPIFPH
jgi:hypothetical protein